MVYFLAKKKFGPILVHFGYFVASLRTFWCTFTGLCDVQKNDWYVVCQLPMSVEFDECVRRIIDSHNISNDCVLVSCATHSWCFCTLFLFLCHGCCFCVFSISWSANDCVLWFIISNCVFVLDPDQTLSTRICILSTLDTCVFFLHIIKCTLERFPDIPVPLLSFHLRRYHLRFRGIEWFYPFSQSEGFLPQTQFVSLLTLDFYNL